MGASSSFASDRTAIPPTLFSRALADHGDGSAAGQSLVFGAAGDVDDTGAGKAAIGRPRRRA